jgi:preprotein translocase subunit SecD
MVLVIVYMFVSYGLFGLFADIALCVNIILILAALSALQATLTLPGIAGIVLTMGMAVDANVLIFERIREEVKAGRSVRAAIEAGYDRAISTIIDSNLTTLFAALFLFIFGSGPIKGFAVTLSLGIITSMFTAILVTRLIITLYVNRTRPKLLSL